MEEMYSDSNDFTSRHNKAAHEMAARQQSIEMADSDISAWFSGKTVFITGATGFMGKVLVEKLLSSCPGIVRIYVLLRRKKDQSPKRRLEQMKQMVIFDNIRRNYSSRLDKIIAVDGDITLPDLGLSMTDKQQLSTVNVVFHTAATVKFDEALKLSVTMNILATQRLMQICKGMPKLEAFVHVSTAYCNCDQDIVEEKIYPPPACLSKVITVCDSLSDDVLQDVTKKIIGNRPNTYTFTKAMGEQVIADNAGMFPIGIFRPSIVTASLETPLPGWVDNLNGATGLLAGAGKGVLRSLLCRRKYVADLIPVDIAINTLIAVAWDVGVEKSKNVKVYNCTTGQQNPLIWEEIEKWGHYYLVNNPFDNVFWYPGGSFKDNKYLHSLCVFLFQKMPAYITDYGAWALGKKPSMSMVRLQEKLQSAITALEYFTTHQWVFVNENVLKLQEKMSHSDKRLFPTDVMKIEWKSYLEQYIKGTRKFILKEKDEDIEQAKRHMRKMYIVHQLTEVVVMFVIIRAILNRSETARHITFGFINFLLSILTRIFQVVNDSKVI